jgi:hypothetical protein
MLAGAGNVGIPNDAVATAATQHALGIPSDFVSFVYPKTLTPPPITPKQVDPSSIITATAAELTGLFTTSGSINQRLQRRLPRPDVVILQVSSHGSPTGETTWGSETIRLADLHAILGQLHALYRAPVILFLDKCHAGTAKLLLDNFKAEEWAKDTYVIMASLAPQFSFAVPFHEVWEQRDHLWPTAVTNKPLLETIRKVFDDNTEYGRTTISFLVGVLGGARDRANNGLDADDIYLFIDEAEKARIQPPINAPLDTRSDVVSSAAAFSSNDQVSWATKFALTEPSVGIDLIEEKPAFMDQNSFARAIAGARQAFIKQAQELQFPPNSVIVDVCKTAICPHQWRCSIDYDQQTGHQFVCEHRPRGTQARTSWTPDVDNLIEEMTKVARGVLTPLWSPAVAEQGGDVELDRGPVTYGVLLDRSKSTSENDPGGQKRRFFYDSVIEPAIRQDAVCRLIVVSFSDTVKQALCYDRTKQTDLDFARRCYMQQVSADGRTNLIDAAQALAPQLAPDDVVWVLTDGMHNTGQPRDHLSEVGKTLSDEHSVYAVFLKGPSGDELALRDLTQLRAQSDDGRFLFLDNAEAPSEQRKRLVELGVTSINQSLSAIVTPRRDCQADGPSAFRCRLMLDVDVAGTIGLRLPWDRIVVGDQSVEARMLSRDGAPVKGQLAAPVAVARGNPVIKHESGFTLTLQITEAATYLTWTPSAAAAVGSSRWRVEFRYVQTGVEK